ncbi:hypothetical protein FA15DRAFT_676069 [Coprinopsis marcescibilis]|uniref:Uncharacterized protein n=1 Tax=Coprinopsis marcescibilis TaxID=230819 RepID=A0A5C3KBI2_COPMA|nr:hypothetical protein FA15DRAFT_676069 [Coprinopsis marcescibilis]
MLRARHLSQRLSPEPIPGRSMGFLHALWALAHVAHRRTAGPHSTTSSDHSHPPRLSSTSASSFNSSSSSSSLSGSLVYSTAFRGLTTIDLASSETSSSTFRLFLATVASPLMWSLCMFPAPRFFDILQVRS